MARIFIFCAFVFLNFTLILTQPIEDTTALSNKIQKGNVKSRTFYDYQTRIAAFKDVVESRCLLEFLKHGESLISENFQKARLDNSPKTFFMSENQLSKRQIWTLGGQRIMDFCRGFPTYLIQEVKSENQDAILNDVDSSLRKKRDTKHFFVGRVRGQTQSQYLSFGNSKDPGKAEAESTYGSSKAAVSGSSGIGQAQSQSSPYSCDECYGQENYDRQSQGLQYGKPGKYSGSQPLGPDPGIHLGGNPEIAGEQVDGRPVQETGDRPTYPGQQIPSEHSTSHLSGTIGFPEHKVESIPGQVYGYTGQETVSGVPGYFGQQVNRPDQQSLYPNQNRQDTKKNNYPEQSGSPTTQKIVYIPGYSGQAFKPQGSNQFQVPYVPDQSGQVTGESPGPLYTYPGQSRQYPIEQKPSGDVSQLPVYTTQPINPQKPNQYHITSVLPNINNSNRQKQTYSNVGQENRFSGQVSGEYDVESGKKGKFSGRFSGQYENNENVNTQSRIHEVSRVNLMDNEQKVTGHAPGYGNQALTGQSRPYFERSEQIDQIKQQGSTVFPTGQFASGIPGQNVYGQTQFVNQPEHLIPNPNQPEQFSVGQLGTTLPGQLHYFSGQPGQHIPSQLGQVIPGPVQQIAPGQIIPGLPGQVVTGEQEQYIPAQPGQSVPGQFIPSQPRQVLPGELGQAVLGGQIISGQSSISGQPRQSISGQAVQFSPEQSSYGQIPSGQISGQTPGYDIEQQFTGQYDRRQPGTSGIGGQVHPTNIVVNPGSESQIPNYSSSGQYGQYGLDDSDSQVQTSIQQIHNKTLANAAAQGKYQGGTAQSQVSGAYAGTGSFSASAGSDDGKRGAMTQISGGKEGAISAAQGRGGLGQSQAQVQLSSDTGDTISSAQTGGFNHGSQTQVQAGGKGGLADAQANGPGSTSSQAQIGFAPYGNEQDNQDAPFRGGGMASAQSGTHSGQAQSQIQGKLGYGIKYTGAAQAGSGRKIIPLAQNRSESFPSFQPAASSGIKQNSGSHQMRKSEEYLMQPKQDGKIPEKTDSNEEDYNEDYEEYETNYSTKNPETKSIISQKSKQQSQHIVLDPLEDLDATVYQSNGDFPKDGTILQPGELIPGSPGYQIPQGFRGKVKSIAHGPNTFASGKHSQAQSVTLTPGTGKVIYRRPIYAVSSKTHFQNGQIGYGSGYTYQPAQNHVKSGRSLPDFVSVSKSETGSKNLITGKKTPSVYYSQASSCGVFTNTCVFNASGKVCFPKPKINPDGTLMTC